MQQDSINFCLFTTFHGPKLFRDSVESRGHGELPPFKDSKGHLKGTSPVQVTPFEDILNIRKEKAFKNIKQIKFKVKLTPGTGRRGKASKMAVMIFQKDKNCSTREKDLLKSVKEEMIARNIPGKVKLSAPQLQKFKK
uniref:NFACT protein C-terminal domain-containing protein n=1 Tax=Phlebotomus papatasi TaxID=29031 RepID=A0A1B0GPH2_PHLPP